MISANMGRYYYSKKEEADALRKIETRFLNKHGFFNYSWRSDTLTWSRNGEVTATISIEIIMNTNERYLNLIYTQTDRSSGQKTNYDYKIPLTTTPCYFGGKRYWFICPWYSSGVYCGRRVGTLYLGDKYFACRHCNNLTYNSRNLGGIFKTAGQVISEPYLEELKEQIGRKYYAGKMTRKYKIYLKKDDKPSHQLLFVLGSLGKRRKSY